MKINSVSLTSSDHALHLCSTPSNYLMKSLLLLALLSTSDSTLKMSKPHTTLSIHCFTHIFSPNNSAPQFFFPPLVFLNPKHIHRRRMKKLASLSLSDTKVSALYSPKFYQILINISKLTLLILITFFNSSKVFLLFTLFFHTILKASIPTETATHP